jgi:NhaP-type Na+/H+ or K+/H+ antiporter
MWFYETWVYKVILSCAYGALCGYIAGKLLHCAEERDWVDRESFLIFALALTESYSVWPVPKDQAA